MTKKNSLVPISELFNIRYGNSLELINLVQCKSNDINAVPLVSRTEKNNGISAFVKKELEIVTNPAHTLSVAVSGSVLSTFYQPLPYYTSYHVLVLIPKVKMNVIDMLFYAKCISINKYKYNYGRQANKTLKDILIPEILPSELNNYLSCYYTHLLKEIKVSPLLRRNIELDFKNWKNFVVGDLFNIKKSLPIHAISLMEVSNGKMPYVTRTELNNGIERFVESANEFSRFINLNNCISIGGEGLVAFYQPLEFISGNNITLLYSSNLNKYNALFFITILTKTLKEKFSYGRGANKKRISELSIKLPEKDGQPDFEFMENYIKSLPYSGSI